MASWFWLNIPACVVVFSVVVGIPLWLVFKRPDEELHHPRAEAAAQAHSRAANPAPDCERVLELTH
jgi:hypothetical protein